MKALNGRLKLACERARRSEPVQTFFIPVTIDSDIDGTECIGQHTAVEAGAEKIRCFVADGYTHQRCYIIGEKRALDLRDPFVLSHGALRHVVLSQK